MSYLLDRDCNETEVRVVNGTVQICLDGFWRAVCGDGWDYRDANVVCRQLGYDGRESLLNFHSSIYTHNFCVQNHIHFLRRAVVTRYVTIAMELNVISVSVVTLVMVSVIRDQQGLCAHVCLK